MEEKDILSLVAMETAEPKWKITRSAGAVYIILIALMIGTISPANLLYARWQIPRYAVQPSIYALIAICGFYIYKRHTISYRYTLTDRIFAIERITANKERTIAAASLEDIDIAEDSTRAHGAVTRGVHASTMPRRLSKTIYIEEKGTRTAYRISPSEELLKKLAEQIRIVKAKRETEPT
jgi:hypothetical protein